MPIKKENGKYLSKSNGVDTKVDPWKEFNINWVRVNSNSDKPNKKKNQVKLLHHWLSHSK